MITSFSALKRLNKQSSLSVVVMIFISSVVGCAQSSDVKIALENKTFKVTFPYQASKRGIIIDSYWGRDNARHRLLWDNHSPTWASDNVIQGNKSISKSKGLFYKTTTADGVTIRGDVYTCERVVVGGIEFNNVSFYNIPGKTDGALGENIISKGVWKINFMDHTLTFASSIDSIDHVGEMEIIPAKFTKNGILIEIAFRNNVTSNVELDFGFNGGILMPPASFSKILQGNPRNYKDSLRFSTPGKRQAVVVTNAYDTFKINDRKFATFISSHNQTKVSLIGMGFFQQFQFLVLDYINEVVYFKKD